MSPQPSTPCARCERPTKNALTVINRDTNEKLTLGRFCAVSLFRTLSTPAKRAMLAEISRQRRPVRA